MKKHIAFAFILFSVSSLIFGMDSERATAATRAAITVAHIKHQQYLHREAQAKVKLYAITFENLKRDGYPLVDLTGELDESPEWSAYHQASALYHGWKDNIFKKLDRNP